MKTGMLWFDDDPKRALSDKVERATNRYVEKYGAVPTLCYANPATAMVAAEQKVHIMVLTKGVTANVDVLVKQARSILPNHLWLGMAEDSGLGSNMQVT